MLHRTAEEIEFYGGKLRFSLDSNRLVLSRFFISKRFRVEVKFFSRKITHLTWLRKLFTINLVWWNIFFWITHKVKNNFLNLVHMFRCASGDSFIFPSLLISPGKIIVYGAFPSMLFKISDKEAIKTGGKCLLRFTGSCVCRR